MCRLVIRQVVVHCVLRSVNRLVHSLVTLLLIYVRLEVNSEIDRDGVHVFLRSVGYVEKKSYCRSFCFLVCQSMNC